MRFPFLWKINSVGNITVWRVWTEDEFEIKERFIITPKTGISKDIVKTNPSEPIRHVECNMGKSNYKSAKMVAHEKAERSWTDMVEKRGYQPISDGKTLKCIAEGDYQSLRNYIFESAGIRDVDDAKQFSHSLRDPMSYKSIDEYLTNPMTCMLSNKLSGDIEFPVIAQRKYDGHRFICTVIAEELVILTRQKKRKELIPHIMNELVVLIEVSMDIRDINVLDGYFDCEAVGIDHSTGKHLSRQQVQSRVSRSVNKHTDSDEIYFVIFDYAVSEEPQSHRTHFLLQLFNDDRVKALNHIKLCKTELIDNYEELQRFHRQNLRKEYEGTILRDPNGLYTPGRSNNSLKLKETYTEEGVILDADCGRGSAADCVIWIIRSVDNDTEYRAVHEANVEKRRKYYKHKDRYIGRVAVVRFYSRNDSGIPCHAVVEGFRDDFE